MKKMTTGHTAECQHLRTIARWRPQGVSAGFPCRGLKHGTMIVGELTLGLLVARRRTIHDFIFRRGFFETQTGLPMKDGPFSPITQPMRTDCEAIESRKRMVFRRDALWTTGTSDGSCGCSLRLRDCGVGTVITGARNRGRASASFRRGTKSAGASSAACPGNDCANAAIAQAAATAPTDGAPVVRKASRLNAILLRDSIASQWVRIGLRDR